MLAFVGSSIVFNRNTYFSELTLASVWFQLLPSHQILGVRLMPGSDHMSVLLCTTVARVRHGVMNLLSGLTTPPALVTPCQRAQLWEVGQSPGTLGRTGPTRPAAPGQRVKEQMRLKQWSLILAGVWMDG